MIAIRRSALVIGAVLAVLALAPPAGAAGAKPAAAAALKADAGAPVAVELLGVAADKEHVRYRIHVNTAKPIEQVDLSVSYRSAGGAKQTETIVWQNIVHSKRQPIDQGKAYEDDSYLGPDLQGVEGR